MAFEETDINWLLWLEGTELKRTVCHTETIHLSCTSEGKTRDILKQQNSGLLGKKIQEI